MMVTFSASALFVLLTVNISTGSIVQPPVQVFLSSKEGRERLAQQENVSWVPASAFTSSSFKVQVKVTSTKQNLEGFGGAITDSAAFVYSTLDDAGQEDVIEALYGDGGNRLTLMRVPIGASDFSTSVYSYDETDGDFELDYFSVEHDSAYILPMIQSAQAAAAKRTEWTESLGDRRQFGAEMNQVRVLATPWSAPSWMKRNKHVRDSLTPGLEQDSDTQEAYAAYVSKFVVEYAAHGVDIWAISVQNEPHVAGQVAFTYPCMGFSGSDEGKFLGQYLGPRLKADHPDLKIFIHDDQKQKQKGDTFMVDRVNDILDTGWNASQFVDGAAYHWYGANLENYVALEQVHSEHPDLVLLATEATLKWPSLAKWQQGVKYAIDIIGDLNTWSSGWVEWNVLLDGRGGPTCIGPGLDSNWTSSTDCEWEILHNATFGHCDAPIRVIRDGDGKVDGEGNRLYFGVQYYMMGHFSRFLPPGTTVVNSTVTTPLNSAVLSNNSEDPVKSGPSVAMEGGSNPTGLMVTAALTPQGSLVIVVLNQQEFAVDVVIEIPDDATYEGLVLPLHLPADAIATLVG